MRWSFDESDWSASAATGRSPHAIGQFEFGLPGPICLLGDFLHSFARSIMEGKGRDKMASGEPLKTQMHAKLNEFSSFTRYERRTFQVFVSVRLEIGNFMSQNRKRLSSPRMAT